MNTQFEWRGNSVICRRNMLVAVLIVGMGCSPVENAAREVPESTGGQPSARDETPDSAALESDEPAPPIMVEVQGAVTRPGVYQLRQGERIDDALKRAGGASDTAELRDLNLAARVMDGSVLSVPFRQLRGQPPEPTAAQLNPPVYTRSGWRESGGERGGNASTSKAAQGCTDLNNAGRAELEALPGVGPKTAAKIMRYREGQPFSRVEDLRNVSGIGDARMETLRGLVCVRPPATRR